MKRLIVLLLELMLLQLALNDSECEGRFTLDECISNPQCVYAMNSYYNNQHKECLMINSIKDVKLFCNYFLRTNNEQGFTTVHCQSSSYTSPNNSILNDSHYQGYSLSLYLFLYAMQLLII